jgi:hypothetical protein
MSRQTANVLTKNYRINSYFHTHMVQVSSLFRSWKILLSIQLRKMSPKLVLRQNDINECRGGAFISGLIC